VGVSSTHKSKEQSGSRRAHVVVCSHNKEQNALRIQVKQVKLLLAAPTIAVSVLQDDPWRVVPQEEPLQFHETATLLRVRNA
jgi:hypothetical protein